MTNFEGTRFDFTPEAIFRRLRPLSELPIELKLRSLEWSLLFALTGRHSVAQLGALLGLSPTLRDITFASLLAHGLIEERALSLDEYRLSRAARANDEPRTLAAFVSAEQEPLGLPPDAAAPVVGELGGALASVIALPGRRRLNLKALMDFLIRRAANEEAGQLDIYRAFLKLDPALLRSHGITTLRFAEDRLIHSPELERNILDAVESTLHLKVPEEVFG